MSKVKESRIFLRSFRSIFHVSHYLFFSYRRFLHNLVVIVEANHRVFLERREGRGNRVGGGSYAKNRRFSVKFCSITFSPPSFPPIHISHISHFITFLYNFSYFACTFFFTRAQYFTHTDTRYFSPLCYFFPH